MHQMHVALELKDQELRRSVRRRREYYHCHRGILIYKEEPSSGTLHPRLGQINV
jgi:hypothetical protein